MGKGPFLLEVDMRGCNLTLIVHRYLNRILSYLIRNNKEIVECSEAAREKQQTIF